MNPDEVPNINLVKESYDIRVENTRLKEENEILRQKMDALLTFIKDHKEAPAEKAEEKAEEKPKKKTTRRSTKKAAAKEEAPAEPKEEAPAEEETKE